MPPSCVNWKEYRSIGPASKPKSSTKHAKNTRLPSHPPEPLCPHEPATRPFKLFHCNLGEFNGQHFLFLIDQFSGWAYVERFAKVNITTGKIVDALREFWRESYTGKTWLAHEPQGRSTTNSAKECCCIAMPRVPVENRQPSPSSDALSMTVCLTNAVSSHPIGRRHLMCWKNGSDAHSLCERNITTVTPTRCLP